jgi:hypothetical protein
VYSTAYDGNRTTLLVCSVALLHSFQKKEEHIKDLDPKRFGAFAATGVSEREQKAL